MTENTNITHSDIPMAMQALGISEVKDFAEQLGVTARSLSNDAHKPMTVWRQMSIECLLRRADKWELFCQLRGDPVQHKEPLSGERCVICHKCLAILEDRRKGEQKGS
ncbi:hypothetical protein [Aeromonas hydrophila]|uniref:hypothetical protein n=1 Tax=Aeromonas hydrophila TaxID=644 RepID=UPI0011CB3C24|nr:hypothetical protein [Aeromonas hydrophila]